jgi:hypothetical protein
MSVIARLRAIPPHERALAIAEDPSVIDAAGDELATALALLADIDDHMGAVISHYTEYGPPANIRVALSLVARLDALLGAG